MTIGSTRTTKPVVIFGTGDFARMARVYFTRDGAFEVAAFTVDRDRITDGRLLDLDVVPYEDLTTTHPPDRYAMFVAVGYSRMNKARAAVYERCKADGYELVTYVCSKAVVWGENEIGDNCFIFENNVIQPFVKIGSDVVLWSGNHVGHDSTIRDHVFVASHAVIAGNVTVGEYTFMGVNATVRDGVTIAPECLVGAGALVLKDTERGQVFPGEATKPARILSSQLRGMN